MTAIEPLRHISADPAFNLRDLGGYATASGQTTRWRALFRADGLHRVTPDVATFVEELGLRTVIDLRTAAELEWGTFGHSAVQWIHLPVLRETWEGSSFDDEPDPADFLAARYLEMLEEGAPALASALQLLASTEVLPAVFHCSAGKDRTGVLAALVLALLGVSDEDIAADYHLSEPAMDRMVEWLRVHRPEAIDHMAQQPAAFLACPPEAMLRFLDAMRDRHGSTQAYLREIGVGEDVGATLRDRLLD